MMIDINDSIILEAIKTIEIPIQKWKKPKTNKYY